MLKIALCLSLLVPSFYNVDEDIVEKIEYNVSSYSKEGIELDVSLNINKRMVLTMKVYFYDENKNILNNKYYASSVVLEKHSETKAKIPIQFNGKIYLNIMFENGENNEEIDNLFFPIYEKLAGVCDFGEEKMCDSKYPVKVVYQKGFVNEFFEKIFLVEDNLHMRSYDNRLPIEKLAIKTSVHKEDGYAALYIYEKYDYINVYYDGKYEFPLEIYSENGIINFKIANKYYLNYIDGKISEEYFANSVFDNNLVFPFNEDIYYMDIVLVDAFYVFDIVKLPFVFEIKGNLIGRCNDAKYCIKRGYL